MINLTRYKKQKDKILENCYFTSREEKVFLELISGTFGKELPQKIGVSPRSISYDIKHIKEKIEKYINNNQEVYFYVYIHTFPNNKKYVGVTENVIRRWGKDGLPYSKNIKMYEDIIHYGWENIKHDILLKTESETEARNLEKKLIELLDLTNESNGYNNRI